MMFVGFLGCYGAIQESQCLLGTVSRKLQGWGVGCLTTSVFPKVLVFLFDFY